MVKDYEWDYSLTSKDESCVIITYKLEGIRGVIKEWLLYERPWGKRARFQIEMMQQKRIEFIYIKDRNAKFPKISSVLYKEDKPILSTNKGTSIGLYNTREKRNSNILDLGC